jgi:hypothetical protein
MMVAMVELVIKVKDTPLAGPLDLVGADAFGLAAEAAATAAAFGSVDILIVRRRGKNGSRNI